METITTEHAEELSKWNSQKGDHVTAEALRALAKERDELLRSVESYRFALAETEALEMQHGAVIARLKTTIRNLEARDIHSCGPDCQRSGCVNRRLTEQLAAVERDRDCWFEQAKMLQHQNDQAFGELRGEIDRLEKELAAAQATIQKMREAGQLFMDSHEECEDFDGFTAQIVSMDDYHAAQEALADLKPLAALNRARAEAVRMAWKIVVDATDDGNPIGIERDVYVWNRAIKYCSARISALVARVEKGEA